MTTSSTDRRGRSLLETLQGLLERTYRMRTGVRDVGRFVIGDAGYRRLYRETRVRTAAASDGSGAKTLIRETAQGVRACVYLPDRLVRTLESYPPQHGLCELNVDPFATLVEELDHLLVIAERARDERETSLFELELHANVSKYLVLSRFLAGRFREPLPTPRKLWLRHHLFEKVEYCDEDPGVRERYREAAHYAVGLIDGLAPMQPEERVEALRDFHRLGAGEKIRLIRSLG
jgi:hypothetical protein